MLNIKASKSVPMPNEPDAKIQAKILALENKILRLENKMLKQEQQLIKITSENTRLKEMKVPVNISITGFDDVPKAVDKSK